MKYVIMLSGSGDYWVGKTQLELPIDAITFDGFEAAREEVMPMCEQCRNRDELELMNEDEVEEITDKVMWKWLA